MAAGPACRCRPPQLFQKTPIDRPRQLHQRVFHIDNLVKPRAEQILLTGLPSLAWSHRKSPAPSARARRITACDSKESSKSICKEIALQRPKTGKFDYLSGPVIQLIQWLLNSSRTTKSIRSCLKSWRPIDLTLTSPRRARPLNSPNPLGAIPSL